MQWQVAMFSHSKLVNTVVVGNHQHFKLASVARHDVLTKEMRFKGRAPYIDDFLAKYGLTVCNPTDVPLKPKDIEAFAYSSRADVLHAFAFSSRADVLPRRKSTYAYHFLVRMQYSHGNLHCRLS